MDKLDDIYYNVSDPGGYASVLGLYRSARERGLDVTIKNVREYLARQDAYGLHKPARIRFKRNKTISSGVDSLWQADLIDVQSISKHNDGKRYLLSCIDVFSKMAFVEAVNNKRGETIATALVKIFDRGRSPASLNTDHGSEFIAQAVQKELKQRGIKYYAHHSEIKCAVIERWNRTIQTKMYRYFTGKGTLKYIDVLQDLVSSYNTSYHSSIKCKPIEVTSQNTRRVWETLYGDQRPTMPIPYTLEVGDIVRISKSKRLFEKGYLPNFSEELFRVVKRLPRKPPVYMLEDLKSEPVLGTFYSEQVLKVYKDLATCEFKIEKVIKRRRNPDNTVDLFVKFLGYNSDFNDWVREVDLQ